jgi:hypothetical protein
VNEQNSIALYIVVILAVLVFLAGLYAFVRNIMIAWKKDQNLETPEAPQTNISLELSEHIEQLYSTFEKYPLKDQFEFDSEDMLWDLEALLHRRPLRLMEWSEFGTYPGKALTTFGDIEDFKHFLPRIFDLYVSDFEGARYDIFYIFSRFELAGFDVWKQEEKKAVFQFLYSWLDELKSDETSREDDFPAYGELLTAIEEYKIFDYDKQAPTVH